MSTVLSRVQLRGTIIIFHSIANDVIIPSCLEKDNQSPPRDYEKCFSFFQISFNDASYNRNNPLLYDMNTKSNNTR